MRRCIILSVLCSLFAVLLPVILWQRTAPVPVPEKIETDLPTPSPEGVRADSMVRLTLLTEGEVRALTLEEYLPGVVAAEMPASFEPDALRAQAVAARTYTLYKMQTRTPSHPEADMCDNPGCCQTWLTAEVLRGRWQEEPDRYAAKIRSAVEDTDGMVLTSEGEPILACFHASSPGRTESSAALWGRALPWLVSVDSPETAADVPGFVSTLTISADELRRTVTELAPEADFSGPPESWPGEQVVDPSGRIAALRIGGAALTGAAIREAFSLRSTAFTLVWTGEGFVFTVTGSGHGAGMSQYGANVMAKNGSPWQEILRHYYPGAALTRWGELQTVSGG